MDKKKVISTIKGHLEMMAEDGITHVLMPHARGCVKEATTTVPTTQPNASKRDRILSLKATVDQCRMCAELASTRTQTVFGAGHVNARLMFVGEAPGMDEDAQGVPFVGKAGKLLTKMIEAMGLSRSDVFIANVLKCRPPQNRNPLPEEIAHCEPYLLEQLAIIKPRVICALGTFAAQTLLKTDITISRLRGEFHDYHGIKLLPTFHPAYLLRNQTKKREAWQDMQMIMKELG
jgi:uracil-DNA glycosylase